MGIFLKNIKFLCLALWLGEVCTNDDANDNDVRWTKYDCIRLFSLVDKPNVPKIKGTIGHVFPLSINSNILFKFPKIFQLLHETKSIDIGTQPCKLLILYV